MIRREVKLMVKYPVEKLESICHRITELTTEYRNSQSAAIYGSIPWENRTREMTRSQDDFMNKASYDVYPEIHKVLGEIDALLSSDEKAISERIRPILDELEHRTTYQTNPLGYTELSAKLMRLAGHLSVRVIATPKVFVGYRYTDEDEIIAKKFIELFRLEGFNPTSGKPAKAIDVDEKVKGFIDESDGVIIIFTRDKKLEGGKWTSSGCLKDEKAYSMGRDKPILLFFDDCIEESERNGIQGDLEHVVFRRDCLDDSFLKAIPYLRDFRQRIL